MSKQSLSGNCKLTTKVGRRSVFKLARTYDELNKYKKKKILCHRNFICSNFYSAHAITCANSLLPFLLPSSLFPSSLARSLCYLLIDK